MAGQDTLPATGPHDPRGNLAVEAATLRNVDDAFQRWLAAPRAPEDHMIFYIATHGVVEPERVIALLEDVGKNPASPWRQSLDVTSIARGLPAFGAQASWVFFDACQEVVSDIMEAVAGAQALVPINPTITQMAAGRNRPCFALAGSRFGGKAYAPNADDPPYFTQALLAGLGYACIEAVQGEGWVVTSKQLQYHLPDVANAVLDYTSLETEPLKAPARNMPFLRPLNPQVPVAVRTGSSAAPGAQRFSRDRSRPQARPALVGWVLRSWACCLEAKPDLSVSRRPSDQGAGLAEALSKRASRRRYE